MPVDPTRGSKRKRRKKRTRGQRLGGGFKSGRVTGALGRLAGQGYTPPLVRGAGKAAKAGAAASPVTVGPDLRLTKKRRPPPIVGKPVRGEPAVSKVPPRGTPVVRKAGKGAKGTAATVPASAKAGTPAKPRSLAEPTVTQKAKQQAKRSQQPSRKPGAAAKRRAQTLLAGPAPEMGLPSALELARAEYAPALTGFDAEARQDALAAAERQKAVQGFTLALIQALGGIPAGVAADYQTAATATQGVAQAAADELRGAGTEADARLQADLAAIGAPAEAAAEATKAMGDVFGGGAGVQFFTEGAQPAQMLLGEGARQTAFARQLPAFAGLSGQQNMRQALYEAEQERQDLGSRRAATMREMGARVPYYEMQLETERARRSEAATDAEIKRQAAATNALIAERTFGLKAQGQQFQQAATVQRLTNDRTRIRLQSIQSDRSWQATLRRLGISEANLKLQAAKAEMQWQQRGKKGGFTAAQTQRLSSDAADVAADYYNGVQDADGNVLQEPLATNPNGYQEAMSDLLSRGVPLTIAQRALNRWWRTPGRYGRPKVPYQQRKRGGKR